MRYAKGIITLAAGLSILALVGCGNASPNTSKTDNSKPTTVEAGDNAVVNTPDDLTATDKNSLTELQNDVSANNDQDVQYMVDNGKVLQLPKGTKAYVEDLSFDGIAHIRIESGVYDGQHGYIPYEQLTPVRSK